MSHRADILRELAALDTSIQAHIQQIARLKTELVAPTTTHQDIARIRTSYDVVKHELAHAEAKRGQLQGQLDNHNIALATPARKSSSIARLVTSVQNLVISPTGASQTR